MYDEGKCTTMRQNKVGLGRPMARWKILGNKQKQGWCKDSSNVTE